jgi:hypothetical protein
MHQTHLMAFLFPPGTFNVYSYTFTCHRLVCILKKIKGHFKIILGVQFLALPDFLRNSVSGMGFTQPREYN